MKLASFEAIVRALDEATVRYLVAGGLAVNAHGYLRFTKDIDIVLSPSITCDAGSRTSTVIENDPEGIDWQLTTWEGATREQLRRWSRLTLEEIIAAQEEMAELSRQLNQPAGPQPPKE